MSQSDALPAVVTLDVPPVAVVQPSFAGSEAQALVARVTRGGEKTVVPGPA